MTEENKLEKTITEEETAIRTGLRILGNLESDKDNNPQNLPSLYKTYESIKPILKVSDDSDAKNVLYYFEISRSYIPKQRKIIDSYQLRP